MKKMRNNFEKNFEGKIFPILEKYLGRCDIVVVGVSGGPDSTALLHLLKRFSEKMSIHIIVVHVNHGIRGKAADRDEKFVEKMAKSLGLKFRVKRVRLKGSHVEEKGREVRRSFFEKLQKQFGAKYILTAHTQDDQLETIVFNFLRGSGPAGLAGMKMSNSLYFKPLLEVSKKEILAYLKSQRQKFCTDATNNDTELSRNFIRKKIVPLFEKINPSFKKTVLNNSEIFAGIDDWLRDLAADFLKKNQKGQTLFSLQAYEELPQIIQTAVIQQAYRGSLGVFKNSYNLPLVKVREVQRLLARRIGNKKIICDGGRTFLLKNSSLELS